MMSQRSTRDVPSLATCPVVLDDSKRDEALDERFFSDAQGGVQELTDPRGLAAREAIETALVSARRAKLARYVGAATGACALMCLAALARTLMPAIQPSSPAPAAALASAASPLELEANAVSIRERVAATEALERGDADRAIMAAARSIALDPSPGSTWLILGKGYERAGRLGEAKKAYRACVDQARLDVDQCVARLR